MDDYVGLESAQKAYSANLSARYSALEGYEAWYEGRQYDGQSNWWDGECPLWERAPCIVYPVVQIAARSNVDLLFGRSRFPEFVFEHEEEDAEEPDEEVLSTKDAAELDKFLRRYQEAVFFRSLCCEVFTQAQACGSACAVYGLRDKRPFGDSLPAKWCKPDLDQHGNVKQLEVRYPYYETGKNERGEQTIVAKVYRRVIDGQRDIEYKPAVAREDGTEPRWVENSDRTVTHGLGFCPVVWYPLMRGTAPINDFDGQPIHRHVTDEIREHDVARSQWHRGALLSEPQPYEIGVEPGYNPTEGGREPGVISTEHGGAPGPNNPVTGRFVGSLKRPARMKGPGLVWQYPNKDTKVDALTYPGEALKAQEDNCRDLRLKLQEALCVVFLDPESIKFASSTSGKALEAIKQKQIDRCEIFRDDVERRFVRPSVEMMLRIAAKAVERGTQLRVRGASRVKTLLKTKVLPEDAAPTYEVVWGSFYAIDVEEQKKLVAMVVEALSAEQPVVTLRVALQKLAPVWGVRDVAELEKQILEELDKREVKRDDQERRALSKAHDLMMKAGADAEPGAEPGGGGAGEAKSSGSGGGSAGGPGAAKAA